MSDEKMRARIVARARLEYVRNWEKAAIERLSQLAIEKADVERDLAAARRERADAIVDARNALTQQEIAELTGRSISHVRNETRKRLFERGMGVAP